MGIQIGEAVVGTGANAAHVNVVLGNRTDLGPFWGLALASPGPGHTPFDARPFLGGS